MAEELDNLHQATLEALHARLDRLEAHLTELDRYAGLIRHREWIKVLLSGFTATVIGFTGPLLSVAASVEGPIPTIAWVTACFWAAMTAAKDTRSLLDLPPINGSASRRAKGD